MFDNKSYIEIKGGSERNFGLVFATVFMIICLYPILKGESLRVWALLISIILFFLSFFFSKLLILPNKLWLKFGILLGSIVSPVIMGIIFFLTIAPIGIFMRLLGKDLLSQKLNKSIKSYWIKRKNSLNSFKNQF